MVGSVVLPRITFFVIYFLQEHKACVVYEIGFYSLMLSVLFVAVKNNCSVIKFQINDQDLSNLNLYAVVNRMCLDFSCSLFTFFCFVFGFFDGLNGSNNYRTEFLFLLV